MLFCIISALLILIIIFKTIVYGNPTSGWPSLVCIIFMLSGVQLFSVGILSWYMAKLYLETKNRPIFIVDDTNV